LGLESALMILGVIGNDFLHPASAGTPQFAPKFSRIEQQLNTTFSMRIYSINSAR
jgi:hypothetical protein